MLYVTWAAVLLAGLFWTKPVVAAEHAVILVYHHVSENTPAITSVAPEQFAAHLDYLEQNGFHIMALDDIADRLKHREALPERAVSITFDDGYKSVLTQAVPLLKKRGWSFAVFVNPKAVDQRRGIYLSWDELRQVKRAGGLILNHTQNHDHLVRRHPGESKWQWRERVRLDIEQAQRRIEEETGKAPKLIAYPYGEFNPDLKKLLNKMGYIAFAQQSGAAGFSSDLQALPRFPLMGSYAGENAFRLRINSRPLPVSVLAGENNVLPVSRRYPELRLKLGTGAFRADMLNCYYGGKAMKMAWIDRDKGVFEIKTEKALPGGRSKYTCTVQALDNADRYYWYSHLWMAPNADGSWPQE